MRKSKYYPIVEYINMLKGNDKKIELTREDIIRVCEFHPKDKEFDYTIQQLANRIRSFVKNLPFGYENICMNCVPIYDPPLPPNTQFVEILEKHIDNNGKEWTSHRYVPPEPYKLVYKILVIEFSDNIMTD